MMAKSRARRRMPEKSYHAAPRMVPGSTFQVPSCGPPGFAQVAYGTRGAIPQYGGAHHAACAWSRGCTGAALRARSGQCGIPEFLEAILRAHQPAHAARRICERTRKEKPECLARTVWQQRYSAAA